MDRRTLRVRLGLVLFCAGLGACNPHRGALAAAPDAPPGHIVVNAGSPGAAIGADQLGTNLGIWYDVTTPDLAGQLAPAGARILRWPGGSLADAYHWQGHNQCSGGGGHMTSGTAYNPNSTFDNFMRRVALPGGYDVALTAAYGTDAGCDGGGDPAEAAAWVAYVKKKGWDSRVKYWTVGNEVYGSWETDLHPNAHSPAAYVAAMNGPSGYYARMKAADPKAEIGVVISGTSYYNDWDKIVLSQAKYDYVELHAYAQQPGKENDDYLIGQAPADLAGGIDTVRSELAAAGRTGTPIMLGEVNSVAYNDGKQTVSIVDALFAAQALVTGIQEGLAVDTWWFGDGGTQGCGHNNSPDLYGFQSWGSYDLVFGNTAFGYNSCTNNNGGPIVPEGTLSPAGQAFRLVSDFAQPGEHLLPAGSGSTGVIAYAATERDGYAVLLVNRSERDAQTLTVDLNGAKARSYRATDEIYGKAQYDESARNVWPGSVRAKLGSVGGSFQVTLPPWSIMLVRLRAANH